MSDERRPTLSHRIEHALFMGAVRMSALAGARGSAIFGASVGRLGYFPLRFRRHHVEKHLRIAFPDKDDRWLHQIMRAVYAHLGREGLAVMRLARMSRDELLRRTDVAGMDVLQSALSHNKGVVLVSGHVGNHEYLGPALTQRGIPMDIVVQRQGNPLFDAALIGVRERMGVGVIDRAHSTRPIMNALRQGRVVGFAADQNAGKAGLFVPFFGKPASTHRGASVFAVKTGAPMVLATSLRVGDRYQITVRPVEVDRAGDTDDVVYRLTCEFTRMLEEVVRSAPDQYLWLHRRWKTRPPGT